MNKLEFFWAFMHYHEANGDAISCGDAHYAWNRYQQNPLPYEYLENFKPK